MYRKTWIEIDLNRLANNFNIVKQHLNPQTRVMAVVKADAYGHGAVPVAKHLLACGASGLCVATQEEGVELREGGISAPILVLGVLPENSAQATVRYKLIQQINSAQALQMLEQAAAAMKLPVQAHLKIDSGMGRLGLRNQDELTAVAQVYEKCRYTKITGVFSHFAVADEEDGETFTRQQFSRFMSLASQVKKFEPDVLLHCANSAATMRFPEMQLDMVRPGVILFGTEIVPNKTYGFQGVMSLKTVTEDVRLMQPGDTISYGRTFTVQKPTMVTTLPVGYGDGYKRVIGNRGYVLIGGKRATVLGRVCMDRMIVCVDGIDVKPGDEAVLLGRQGKEEITAAQMAQWADTIPYEIMLSFTPRVPRLYVQ